MFIDSSLELANAETVDATADSSLRVVGGIDLRGGGGKDGGGAITDNATIDLSAGEPIYVVIEVTTEITGTATSNFQLNTHNLNRWWSPGQNGNRLASPWKKHRTCSILRMPN